MHRYLISACTTRRSYLYDPFILRWRHYYGFINTFLGSSLTCSDTNHLFSSSSIILDARANHIRILDWRYCAFAVSLHLNTPIASMICHSSGSIIRFCKVKHIWRSHTVLLSFQSCSWNGCIRGAVYILQSNHFNQDYVYGDLSYSELYGVYHIFYFYIACIHIL